MELSSPLPLYFATPLYLVFSFVVDLFSYLIQNNQNYGIELATGTSALLLAAMAPRAIKTKKNVPMMLTLLGIVGSGYYGRKFWEQINGV